MNRFEKAFSLIEVNIALLLAFLLTLIGLQFYLRVGQWFEKLQIELHLQNQLLAIDTSIRSAIALAGYASCQTGKVFNPITLVNSASLQISKISEETTLAVILSHHPFEVRLPSEWPIKLGQTFLIVDCRHWQLWQVAALTQTRGGWQVIAHTKLQYPFTHHVEIASILNETFYFKKIDKYYQLYQRINSDPPVLLNDAVQHFTWQLLSPRPGTTIPIVFLQIAVEEKNVIKTADFYFVSKEQQLF